MISYFKLWRLLKKRGYQRKDIVRLAGISESTYWKLLASEAVRMDVLQRICVALNVDVGDISLIGHQILYWNQVKVDLGDELLKIVLIHLFHGAPSCWYVILLNHVLCD